MPRSLPWTLLVVPAGKPQAGKPSPCPLRGSTPPGLLHVQALPASRQHPSNRRLWAMPVPLTAPLTRGLGTWPQISPEVSSPFSVGDVSQSLVFPFWSISRCSCLSWTQSPNITPVLGRARGTCLAYRLHS